MCVDILSTALVQLLAAYLLSEAGDTDDIGRLQVLSQEIAASFCHVVHLVPDRGETKWESITSCVFNW